MPKFQSLLKPCCNKFPKVANNYIDTVFHDDYRLRMLANLLLCAKDQDCFDMESLEEIALFIEEFINRKIVREHYFFGRTLKTCTFDDADLSAEIHRVHAKMKQSEGL